MLNNRYMIFGGAIIMVVIIIVASMYFGNGSGNSDMDNDKTATIYIQNVETGQIFEGTVSLNELNFGEQMMLSFGQDIRESALTSVAISDPIAPNQSFKVWVEVDVEATWADVKLKNNVVKFSGKTATGLEISYNNIVPAKAGKLNTLITINDKIMNGPLSTVNMKTEGYEWSYIYNPSASSGTYVPYTTITGDKLDGMVLTVETTLSGVDGNGATVESTDVAELVLDVDMNSTSGSITVAIKDVRAGI